MSIIWRSREKASLALTISMKLNSNIGSKIVYVGVMQEIVYVGVMQETVYVGVIDHIVLHADLIL